MAGARVKPPIPFAHAQQALLDLAIPLPIERRDASEAIGFALGREVMAKRTQPPADLSAMDGYALHGNGGAGPWSLIGESRAGHAFDGVLTAGEAIRISTGAQLPVGSDTILLQEDANREGDMLSLSAEQPIPGKHIRRKGFDFAQGDAVLQSGDVLTPGALALAIGAGHAAVDVHRKPTLAILDNGDELATDPGQCGPGQIPASNGAMLAAMAAPFTRQLERLGPVPDSRAALAAALEAASTADVLVTSGGASVGDHDLVRPALEEWGAQINFWRVAMKPGKPIMVARRGEQLILGLPGNPVSSFVTAHFYLLPLLRKLAGWGRASPTSAIARLTAPMGATGKRHEFIRSSHQNGDVSPLRLQDSGALSALGTATCLIDRPPHSEAAEMGETVTIYPLQNGGIA